MMKQMCNLDNRVTRVAWLNRSSILFAGFDKWSIDPRVILLNNTSTEYSIQIKDVDVYDDGPYVCSILTNNNPKASRVHLIVQVPPRIANISTDITVNEGSSITLMCLAIGRPEPTVTWRHLSSRVLSAVCFLYALQARHAAISELTASEDHAVLNCVRA
ncbi:UNVERIFIED_CONTAM: hypothetical protein FKN15_038853 [Acipenser sinensis]